MPGEHDMHRNKLFITNDPAQGLLVNVMDLHRETLMRMALNMAGDTVMVMEAMEAMEAMGAMEAVVNATMEVVPYLSSVPLPVAFCWVTYCFNMI
jgi:hypothetical protein